MWVKPDENPWTTIAMQAIAIEAVRRRLGDVGKEHVPKMNRNAIEGGVVERQIMALQTFVSMLAIPALWLVAPLRPASPLPGRSA